MKNLRKALAALIAAAMTMALVVMPAMAETFENGNGYITYTVPSEWTHLENSDVHLETIDTIAYYRAGSSGEYGVIQINAVDKDQPDRFQIAPGIEQEIVDYTISGAESAGATASNISTDYEIINGMQFLKVSCEKLRKDGNTWYEVDYRITGFNLKYSSKNPSMPFYEDFYNMLSTVSFTPAAQFNSVINPAEVYTEYATNVNSSGVKNGPTNYISWEVKNNDFVAQAITTYHYNYGNGSDYPGTISIYEDGNLLGTWTAQGRENNIYWDIFPEITMRKGHSYRIEDSDYSTWSYNSGSNGEGFFWLYGYDIGSSSTSTTTTVTPSSNDAISIYVDGNRVYPDSDPVIRNDRTLVPIRVVAEALGYQVDWDGANQAVEIHNSEESLYLTIGSSSINHYFYDYFGNVASTESIYSDVAPQIINDRTYLPLRAVGEALGAAVEWDGNTRSVYITSGVGAVG